MSKHTLTFCALLAFTSLVAFVSPPAVATLGAQSLSATPPASILDLPAAKLKGNPAQLAWSPDSSTLCLLTEEGSSAPLKKHYYTIRLKERDFAGVDVAPDWAAKYWEFKSARTAPGHPEMAIQVQTKRDRKDIPTQSLSDKAKNLGGGGGGGFANATAERDDVGSLTRILTLNGEQVGQYVNQPMVPGMTFSWSPQSLHAIAYANATGHLGLMDVQGGKVEVNDAKDVLLPAWSPDGSQVVYLKKTGRHDYALLQVMVSHP
jgi:hypothetical protein